jgi:hypothetical protein
LIGLQLISPAWARISEMSRPAKMAHDKIPGKWKIGIIPFRIVK